MYNLIFAFVAVFMFSACGSHDPNATGGEGSIAFSVDWENATPPLAKGDSGGFSDNGVFRAASLDCAASGVSTVSATVYSSTGSAIATGGPWACTAHSGSITGVPAGTNRKLVFLGKDSSGYVKYKGEQTGITVTDGQTANAGTITAALFIPTPSSPSDASTVASTPSSFSWTGSSTASSYQLQISTGSSFSSTTVDTIVAATSYTPSTLSAGTYYWRVKASDSYGNTSQWSNVYNFTVSPGATSDTTAPSNTTSANFINSGASSTSSTSVTLALSATDAVGVTAYYASATATTPSATASGWTGVTPTTSYSGSVSFNLSSGDGTKTVYVWFKDAAGNVSLSVNDSINLSTVSIPTAPTGVSATAGNTQATVNWNVVTGATSYNIYWSTTAGVTIANGTKITGATSPYSYPLTNGTTYYFVVTAVNSYGESGESSQVSAMPSSGADVTAPSNTTSANCINSGATSTSSTSVTLALSATDAVGVTAYYASATATTPSASASGWTGVTSTTSYSGSVSFTLSSGDGSKTVYVWFKDAAGNVSAVASDTISLSTVVADNTAPSNYSSVGYFINSGASSTNSTSVALALSATDSVGVTAYYTSETSTAPPATAPGWTSVTSTTSYSGSVSFTLSTGDGTKTVYVWFKDGAGNVSASASDTINLSTVSIPSAPTGVSATAGNTQATVNWSAVTGATSYNVYWSTTTGVTTANGTKITGAVSPYTHTGLTNGTSYYYIVTAANIGGESVASSQASTMPLPSIPTAPTPVSASAGNGQSTITWTASTGATSYNLYWSTTTGVTKTNGTKITGATSPYNHTGLTNGTTYYYIVTAVNAGGESTASSQVAATPVPPIPSAPTGVSATAGSTQTTLSWSAVTGATSYNIYWSTSAGVTTANGTKITGATSPYNHTGLSNGTSYYYIVTAANLGGESIASSTVAATPVPVVPVAPTGVSATAGNTQTTISWSAVTGATSYNIYWSTTAGVTIANGTKITGGTSPYTHTGLSNGTTYYYIVTAANIGGESTASSQVSAMPQVPVPAAPTPVSTSAGDGQSTVTWTASTGATSYNLYWSTTTGVTKTNGTKITGATSPYNHTGLTNGTTYYYIVTAVNAGGESTASSQVSATPVPPIPSAPTGVSATAGDTQNTITWIAVSGATSYNIYWSTTTGVTTSTGTKITGAVSPYTHTGLTNGTTYYYIVTAANLGGESTESMQASATLNAGATTPVTNDATSLSETSARLNGSFNNPAGYTTTAWFEYGTTTTYGTTTQANAYATAGTTTASVNLTGLQQNTTYHFRLVTQNSSGTFYGADKTFMTLVTPTILASGLSSASAIAVDSTSVYWTESSAVKKVGINGGTVTILASGLSSASDIAVDSTSVYWTESSAIKKVGINGGTVTTLASGLSSAYATIAVDSTSVYWTESSAIKKVGINGGTVTTLASGLSSAYAIAVDSTSVYWREYYSLTLTVKKVGINGGTVTILASGSSWSSDIAVGSTSVYWTDSITIKKVGINGGTVTTLASGSSMFYDIAVDSTSVYWTENSGAIKKVGINGGTVTTLASGGVTSAIAVDSTSVYWAEGSAIKKVNKDAATTPLPPSNVSASAGDAQATISWTNSTGATSYNIYWSTTAGVTIANGTKITGATSPYTHTGLSNGTSYYYIVTAVNLGGESITSSPVSATPVPVVPVAPTGVSATAGNTQATVNWNVVTGATSYNIYWSTTAGVTTATGTKITGVTSPYTHTGLTAGTTYYYIITAANLGGESAASAQVSATPVPVVPIAPTGVSATAGNAQATVNWSAVTGATSYNIYWSTTAGVTTANGTKITGATSPYIHTGLTNGTTYYYIVTAVNLGGESTASSPVAATPIPPVTNAPTGISAATGNGQTTISWSTVTGATSYNIYWSTTTGVTTSNGTKITGATSPYNHTGLTNGTTYYYIVTAANIGGESAASAQVSATPVLNNVISIAGGYYHTVALKNDGTVSAWGYNNYGQLGDGTGTNRNTPVQVSGLTGITAIAGGESHTIALKNDGTVWAWGANWNGQLGDDTYTNRSTPVQVSGLSGITAIAGGSGHTIALKNDGTVWAWGYNYFGTLGDGTYTNRSTPVQVSGLSGITAIAGGSGHTIALKNDGTAWAWGYNGYGALGDGTYTNRSTPVQVSGLTGITAIAGGSSHTIALKNDGTAWAWGYSGYGALGDGTYTNRSTPVQVSGLSGVTAIAGGYNHTIALKNDGTVWAWGSNTYGALGDGTITTRYTPVQVSGLTGITAVAGGGAHTIALKNDGTVWAWGYNAYGQLGNGTTTDSLTPVQMSGLTASPILAPASVSASSATNSNTISWAASTGATSYNLYWSTSSQFTVLNGTKITGVTSPYTHTGLTGGTTYYYVVTAANAGGESTASSQVSAMPSSGTDVTAPFNTTAANFINSGASSTSATSVTIAMSATDAVGITAYYVSETSTAPSASASGWTAITSTTSYSASVPFTLSSGDGTKTVYVWFKDAAGNVSLSTNDSINLSTVVLDTIAPSNTTASNFINSGVASTTSSTVTLTISATDAVGVTAYYASETSTTPSASASGWTAITSTTSYSASVSFTLSSGDGTKTVYVWFKDAAGNVSLSVNDSINLSTSTTPSAPTGVAATAGNAQGIISWNSVSGATSYNVYYKTTTGVTTSNGTKVAGVTSGGAITGLVNGTTYYFVVTAVNVWGESPVSNEVSAAIDSGGVVTTFAGTAGASGTTDGTGSAARFYNPKGITSDGTNLYLVDSYNHTIRKVVISTGAVTTLAGSAGTSGTADGTGTAARFSTPEDITTDGSNLYVADTSSHTIRKIVISTGAVTTLAGTAGSWGSTDGMGTAARFSTPRGITTTGGNLYVSDSGNNSIRKIVISTGAVTTLAGGAYGSADGTGTAARFNLPKGIATDGTYLYVSDTWNNTIRKVAISSGSVTTLAGTALSAGSTDGTGAAALFNWPEGLTVLGANLYVADTAYHTIRKVVIATGVVTTFAGAAGSPGSTDGTGTAAHFYGPNGVTTNGTNLYVTDTGYNTIRKIQ